MKILFVAPQVPYPLVDGYSRAVFHPIRFLSDRGHEVIFVAPEDPSAPRDIDGLKQFCTVVTVPHSPRRTLTGMIASLPSRQPYFVSRFHSGDLLREVLNQVEREKPDLVQLEQLHCGYYGLQVLERHRIPVILRLHNIESTIVQRFSGQTRNPAARIYSAIEAWKLRRYEASICPRFSRVLAISEDDRRVIESLAPQSRSEVGQSGVDTGFFSPATGPEEENTILLLAAFHWLPNRDSFWWFVKEVFPRVLEQIPSAKLRAVGINPSREMMEYKHGNVEVVGPVEDVRPYISRAALAVVPLRIGSGIRLKLLELIAMQKGVVSTSVGCEGLRLEPERDLVIADTGEDFAKGVVRLLKDRTARHRLGESGRRQIENLYGWDVVLPRYENLLSSVLADSGESATGT